MRLRPVRPGVVTRRAEPGVNCGRNLSAGGVPLRGDAAGATGRGRPQPRLGPPGCSERRAVRRSEVLQNDMRYVSGQMLGPMPRLMHLAASWIWDQPS
jgi:hypothetical protein